MKDKGPIEDAFGNLMILNLFLNSTVSHVRACSSSSFVYHS